MENVKSIPAAPRLELMKVFDRLLSKRIIFIHAPAGYGKTFSVRMWLKQSSSISSWISMSEFSGCNLNEFYKRTTDALLALQPDNAALREIGAYQSFISAPHEYMHRALKAFSSFEQEEPGQYVLVLDDLCLITNTELLKRLPEIIVRLSEKVVLFILSREKPPDSFSEFVLKNTMAILDVDNLKFSRNEIKSFFAACGKPVNTAKAQEIKNLTGGWAIGLNALLLAENQSLDQKLFSHYLDVFIRDKIWGEWSKERQDFMIRVSITDELTPDFCDEITGSTNSREILDTLARENAFISVDPQLVYRFHPLFRDFLKHMLEITGSEIKKELCQKAGDWFYNHAEYCMAIKYYLEYNDENGIIKSLQRIYDYNSPYADIEVTLEIIRLSINEAIVKDHPFLLEPQAWSAFMEGRCKDMENYLDRYFRMLPEIVAQHPRSAQVALLLYCMDYRNDMVDFTISLKEQDQQLFAQFYAPSLAVNMPLFHRSIRDFSEYVPNLERNLLLLRKTLGILLGNGYPVVDDLIRAGIAYECGALTKAYEYALSANMKVGDSFAPEMKFCSYMILATILDAQGQRADAKIILDSTEDMIERDQAYYLSANLRAFLCRMKLDNGNQDAAKEWLKLHADSPHTVLTFYKLHQHFTTARAYITMENYSIAILFLKKLMALCRQYRRPLDVIEVNILLAIAHWKKKQRCIESIGFLEQAIIEAQKYGYTQLFANAGADLSNILHWLYKRIVQQAPGYISSSFVKGLYIKTLARAKYTRGLTGGRTPETLTFTEQQKRVIQYLYDGLTQKEIAQEMSLQPSSIKSHMALIYKKLDVSNSVDALIKINESGILDL